MIVKKTCSFPGTSRRWIQEWSFFSLNQGRHSVVFQFWRHVIKSIPRATSTNRNMIPKAPNYFLRVEYFSTYFRNLNAGDFCGWTIFSNQKIAPKRSTEAALGHHTLSFSPPWCKLTSLARISTLWRCISQHLVMFIEACVLYSLPKDKKSSNHITTIINHEVGWSSTLAK